MGSLTVRQFFSRFRMYSSSCITQGFEYDHIHYSDSVADKLHESAGAGGHCD